MTLQTFKQRLNRIFDDNLRTKQWENYVDYAIIGFIVLSTLQIFLSTYDFIEQHYGTLLKILDYITIAFFSIEVTLRIWCADLLDAKYQGFWGRFRYCCTFYGFIDLISTYSFYVAFFLPIPYHILKVLRVVRLLRIFRYMKAFLVLKRAVVSKKDEMVVSLQFLVIITLMLSFILFFVEHEAQPDVYANGWTSVVWAFVQYIGDPGNFADTPPITFTGRIIATLIGILGIAIFAVPAGLIASGFSDSMAEMQREEELLECRNRLRVLFRRKSASKTSQEYLARQKNGEVVSKYKFILSKKPVVSLQARQHIDLKDILDTVSKYPEFLLKTMSTAISSDDGEEDRLILEHFPINRSYGCFINRKSDITILNTSAFVEIGGFWFDYYVAKLGGFNFICKHVDVDPDDERDNFCNFKTEPECYGKKRKDLLSDPKGNRRYLELLDQKDRQREDYLSDLRTCCGLSDNPWIILGIWHIKNKTNTYDFHYIDHNKAGDKKSVNDLEKASAFLSHFSERMKTDFGYETCEDSTRYPLLNNNILFYIQKQEWGKHVNSFSLRPSSEILCFNSQKAAVAFAWAETINDYLSQGNKMTPEERQADLDGFKEGIGYPEQNVDNIIL